MVGFVSNTILDAALDVIRTNGDRLDICSADPTNYTEATSTYTLGNAAVTHGAVGDRAAGNGRQFSTNAISGASVSGTGTVSHCAITDGTSVLYVTLDINPDQAVTSGNTWSLGATTIGIPELAA